MDLPAALHEYFGFASFRPGQREACEAALGERDVLVVMPTGSGKSLCYQLPALLRDDLTIVVSPLVALMQDQVEALAARGLGDRVALVNAQQDVEANDAVLTRAAAGEVRLLYVAPERFSSPGFAERVKAADGRPVRRRRGPLRLAVGARLPPRLLPPRRRRPPRGRECDRRVDGHRDAARGGRHRAAARPARAAPGRDRVRPPEHLVRGRAPGAAREARARRGGAEGRGRAAGDRLRGHARGVRGDRRRADRGARRGGGRVPRRARPRHARDGSAAVPRRRRPGDRRDERVRDGRRQAERAHGRPRERAIVARGLLPGGRPRGPRRAARAGAAARREPRQGAARPLHQARGGGLQARRRPADAAARGRRRRARPLRARRRATSPARRAARTACARSARAPRPRRRDLAVAVVARPGGGADRRAVRRPRRGGVPLLGRGRRPRALAPVPRDLGVRRARRLPAPGDPAPLRRPRRSRAAPGRRRLLRRLRPGGSCRSCRRCRRRRSRTSTARSSRSRGWRSPRSGAPHAPRSSTARARRRSSATPTTASPPTPPRATCAAPTSSRGSTS